MRENAEKAGLLSRDVSNIQAGDVIGWDTNGHHHVVIADGKGGFFGNSSTMDKVYHSDKAHSFGKPDWVIKTGGNGVTTQTEENSTSENETSETETTAPNSVTETESEVEKFFRDFVNNKRKSENAEEFKNFFSGMIDKQGEFQNTPENQNSVLEKFSDEIEKHLKENSALQEQRKKLNEYLPNDNLIKAIKNFREKAIKANDMEKMQSAEIALSGDENAMRKFIADEGIKLDEKPAENLNIPYKNISDLKKAIALKIAEKPVSKKLAERKKQGQALKNILQENGIEADKTLVGALENGIKGAVTKAQEILRQNEILPKVQENQLRLFNLKFLFKTIKQFQKIPKIKLRKLFQVRKILFSRQDNCLCNRQTRRRIN